MDTPKIVRACFLLSSVFIYSLCMRKAETFVHAGFVCSLSVCYRAFHTQTHTETYINTHTDTQTHTHTHRHTDTHTHTRTHGHTDTHTQIHGHTHPQKQIHTSKHTHTNDTVNVRL